MDAHPMVEEWLGKLLEGEAEVMSAGRASNSSETAALVAKCKPTLVLLEIADDIPKGLEILRSLKAEFPNLRTLVFSSCDEVGYAAQVLRAGARGFVSKSAGGAELLRAIRQVRADGLHLSSAMIGHLAALASESPKTGPAALLSDRELQVFRFIGEGLRPTEIAHRVALSVKTIESYLVRIREKLTLRDARALFQEAVKWTKLHGS